MIRGGPPSALERHSGIIAGSSRAPQATDPVGSDPRAALERILLRHLERGPCVVQFSGGRDSSLVLAVAADVARQAGLEPPTALTVRYLQRPETYESEWQDLVVNHVDVPLEVVEVSPGANELASPFGVEQLERHGPLLPPPAAIGLARIAATVAGRTVLSGQGGDEVLGESRVSLYVAHWRRGRWPDRRSRRAMAELALPRSVRRIVMARGARVAELSPWLTPAAARQLRRDFVEDATDQPWDWRAARWSVHRSRIWQIGSASLARVARHEGFELVHPLMDPVFIGSVCERGGRLGLTTRTEAMRVLVGDLLPEAVLTRRSKAHFQTVYGGPYLRQFATQWDGGGVDTSLVDVKKLRAAWLAPEPAHPSFAPLQLALLDSLSRGWRPQPSGLLA